jgi:lambda family phage portal protein
VSKRKTLLQRLGTWFQGAAGKVQPGRRRQYANARGSRFNVGLGASGSTSADAELSSSLYKLRASSRQMVRDAPYAKRAKTIVVNNVIGPGIGMQAQVKTTRAELNKRVNDDIEAAWERWCCAEYCHTGGKLHFSDLERACMGQVFEAGEVIIRLHEFAMGDGEVPLALELVESERLADDFTQPLSVNPDNEVRMGVEVDKRFGRPQAYWIRRRHPGDLSRTTANTNDLFERVDARFIIHLHITDRWPQTRGEPWMHTALRKLDSTDQYSQAELQAAQNDAARFGTIKNTGTPDPGPSLANNQAAQAATGEKPEMQIENGVVIELEPGEEYQDHQPSRPNTAIDPFLRYMLREIAAGVGVSYESLSRDYSQTTFSSGRLAILDDRDSWRVFQQWWLRSFRLPLHKRWLQQGVYAKAITSVPAEQYMADPIKFEAVKFKPRGWSWVDPAKEVAAYKEAEKAGYISAEDIIAQTANGLDIEDVVEGIDRSRQLYESKGIKRDTDVGAEWTQTSAPAPPGKKPDPDEPDDDEQATTKPSDPPRRVVSLAR